MSNNKSNHESDMSNSNRGTSGLNTTKQQNNNNKANQLNPNNGKYRAKK